MKLASLLLIALTLKAQIVIVCDTVGCAQASLHSAVTWDRATRQIKPKPIVTPPPPPPPPTTGIIYTPKTSAELQAAITKAVGGDEIHLAAGVVYSGNFSLSGKTAPVTIRTADLTWSAAGRRVKPSDGPRMARVATPNSQPAFYASKDADNWRLVGLEIAASASVHTYNAVQLGDLDGAKTLEELPDNILIERCYIHGDAAQGGRRGVLAMGTRITVRDSFIEGFFSSYADSQAIGVYGGLGPFVIENNYLEGSGENLFLSAEGPLQSIPENATIRKNHLKKRLAWAPPNNVVLKNLLEIKCARHVLIEGNVLENNWASGQSGYGVLFTARNGPIPEISDVKFRLNKIINTANGINVLGKNGEGAPTDLGRVFGLVIEHNVIEGPTGRFLGLFNSIENITVRNNTALGVTQQIWVGDGPPGGYIDFQNNAIARGEYGIFHSGIGEGTKAIVAGWREWIVSGNVFIGVVPDHLPGQYPSGNAFVLSSTAVPVGVGIDMAALNNAIAGVVQ